MQNHLTNHCPEELQFTWDLFPWQQICISNKSSGHHGSSAAASLSTSPPSGLNSCFESMKIGSPKINNRNLNHLELRSGNRSSSPPPQATVTTSAGATSNTKWSCLSKTFSHFFSIRPLTPFPPTLKKGTQPVPTVITEEQYKAVLPNLVILTT